MPGNNDRKYSNCWRERERKRIQTAKRNGWTGIYVPATTKTIRRCVFNTTDGNIHPQIGPQQKNMKEYGRAIPRWRQSVSVRPGTFLLKLFRNARLACFWAVGVILTRHRSPVPNWYLPSIDHALDALALLFFPPDFNPRKELRRSSAPTPRRAAEPTTNTTALLCVCHGEIPAGDNKAGETTKSRNGEKENFRVESGRVIYYYKMMTNGRLSSFVSLITSTFICWIKLKDV